MVGEGCAAAGLSGVGSRHGHPAASLESFQKPKRGAPAKR